MIKTFHSDGAVIKEIGEHGFGGYFSTKEIDRDREIIQPTAFNKSIPQYMKNPVVYPCHIRVAPDGSPTQIAKCLRIRVDDFGAYGEFEYAPTKMAKEWKPLIKDRFVSGMSHKSLPGKSVDRRHADGGFVRDWSELELVHIAVEGENSNRGALIGAMGKGISDDTLIDAIVKSIDGEETIEKQLRSELNKNAIAMSVLGKEFGEVVAILKGLASKDDVVKALDDFRSEILDPDGVYARALSNRAATDPSIDENGSSESVLQELLAATQVKR
jgi:hypothetical protein